MACRFGVHGDDLRLFVAFVMQNVDVGADAAGVKSDSCQAFGNPCRNLARCQFAALMMKGQIAFQADAVGPSGLLAIADEWRPSHKSDPPPAGRQRLLATMP